MSNRELVVEILRLPAVQLEQPARVQALFGETKVVEMEIHRLATNATGQVVLVVDGEWE